MKSINIDGFKKLSMRPFKEVTKARFWEMLECLPPRIQATNGFLVGEAYDHKDGRPVYECYVQEADKYFNVGLMNLRTFEFYLTDRTGVAKEIKDLIAKNHKKGNLLLVWEHHNIMPITRSLGVPKSQVPVWADDDYDSIWIITGAGTKNAKLTITHEGLNGVSENCP